TRKADKAGQGRTKTDKKGGQGQDKAGQERRTGQNRPTESRSGAATPKRSGLVRPCPPFLSVFVRPCPALSGPVRLTGPSANRTPRTARRDTAASRARASALPAWPHRSAAAWASRSFAA